MKKQLLSKPYWKRFANCLLLFLVLIFPVIYFILGLDAEFWQPASLVRKISLAFFSAFVFSFRSGAAPDEASVLLEPTPTWKEFFGVLLLMIMLSVVIIAILMAVAWLLSRFVFHISGDFLQAVEKILPAIVAMCVLINAAFFVHRLWKFKKQPASQ